MKNNIYVQNICSDCLQWLENNESNHSEEEFTTMQETLSVWVKEKYYPAGANIDKNGNCEPFFSWSRCELCNGLAGDRYKYNFIDESK